MGDGLSRREVHAMAISGNLRDFKLADVLMWANQGGTNGVLRIVRSDGQEGTVHIRDGEVFFATSDLSRQPLGARLVQARHLTRAQLDEALRRQGELGPEAPRLGSILVDEGFLSPRTLEMFVHDQIHDTVFDLMRWDEGHFELEPERGAASEDIGYAVPIESLVEEGLRRLDEWAQVTRRAPASSTLFKLSRAAAETGSYVGLKPSEWRLVTLMDGTRDVRALARELCVNELELLKTLDRMRAMGLIEAVGGAAPVAATEDSAAAPAASAGESAPGTALEQAARASRHVRRTASVQAVLFDLDGTLLKLEMDLFWRAYFDQLARYFADLVAPARFIEILQTSTKAMMRNSDSDRTNKEVFWAEFLPRAALDSDVVMPLVDRFYEEQFGLLGDYAAPAPLARDAVAAAVALGVPVVIATNPIFPRRAVEHRLAWAGLADVPFDLITTYEFMHACKPHHLYYQEIARLLESDPARCLMVGNDEVDDMSAAEVGMSCFLVEDTAAGRKARGKIAHRGSMADLLEHLRNLA
jgi:FMN phosphatase YigB (HAD superfamily)